MLSVITQLSKNNISCDCEH